MATTYVSREGDVVDDVAFRFYGVCNADTLNAVLAANPGLADLGPVLAAGVRITLPADAPVTTPTSAGVSLWT